MGTKRASKRDLPGSHAQSGLLVKGSFRDKSKQWPVWCADSDALNRVNGLNAGLLDRRTSGN